MIATGLTRRIDKLGRIMVPKAIRSEYGIGEHTAVEIYTNEEYIVIQKYSQKDVEIQSKYHTDNVGRIVLPKSIRKQFLLTENDDYVEIFTEEHSILLKKYEKSCVICGGQEELILVKGKKICRDCLEEIKSIVG
ncbi:MAG: hypothetical protein J6A61_01540 [Clostridia bacterium]|nr:hypothetical protein [Clostridia bacterium]